MSLLNSPFFLGFDMAKGGKLTSIAPVGHRMVCNLYIAAELKSSVYYLNDWTRMLNLWTT